MGIVVDCMRHGGLAGLPAIDVDLLPDTLSFSLTGLNTNLRHDIARPMGPFQIFVKDFR